MRHCGCAWTSWTPAGMIYDIPLGRTLAPHRLALGGLKDRWHREGRTTRQVTVDGMNFTHQTSETLESVVAHLPAHRPTLIRSSIRLGKAMETNNPLSSRTRLAIFRTRGTSSCQIERKNFKKFSRERKESLSLGRHHSAASVLDAASRARPERQSALGSPEQLDSDTARRSNRRRSKLTQRTQFSTMSTFDICPKWRSASRSYARKKGPTTQ